MSAGMSERLRVGTCPVCTYPVWAEVEFVVHVSTYLSDHDSKVNVNSRVELRACKVDHSCARGGDDD